MLPIVALAVSFTAVHPIGAQEARGTLGGRVTDPQQAVAAQQNLARIVQGALKVSF